MVIEDPKFSPKLKMWYREAHREKNFFKYLFSRVIHQPVNQDYAIYPKRFYQTVHKLDHQKLIDYCFIGGFRTDSRTEKNRKWILDFIQTNFSESSYLQFTDKGTKSSHKRMGVFDHTFVREGFVPKEHPKRKRNYFDAHYFQKLANSKFTLCPAGDDLWSMRFYEALMCKSIPIVNTPEETYRSNAESELDYRYYLSTDQHIFREDWAAHNYEIFLRYHTLEYR